MSDIAASSPFQNLPLATPAPPAAAGSLAGAPPAKIKQVAQQFEAIFVRQVLAAARKSSMGDTLFSSDGDATFTQMQDARFADIAASRDALGLAGLIERQLGARSGSAPAPAASATATTSAKPGGGA
jgi:flagellar protein FlgJ